MVYFFFFLLYHTSALVRALRKIFYQRKKKNLGFTEKKFEYERLSISASQHVSMLVCSSLTLHELADIHEAPIASSIEKKILRATVYIQLMTGC